jgi:hypothetical protein
MRDEKGEEGEEGEEDEEDDGNSRFKIPNSRDQRPKPQNPGPKT